MLEESLSKMGARSFIVYEETTGKLEYLTIDHKCRRKT